MKRRDTPEEMDRPDVDGVELFRGLDQLAGINLWLGGWWSVRQALAAAMPREAWQRAVILDVAAGGGDIARRVARAYRRKHIRLLTLDLHPVTLEYARRRTADGSAVHFLRGDGRALPLRAGSVDVALCSLALHHFSESDAVRVLAEMQRVARRAVVVTDLRRSGVAWLLIRLLTRLIWRSGIVRHDGPVSVRRAFTPGELAALAERAGLPGARVLRQPLYRMALVYRIDGGEC
jgi:SAM-dependent methyltransferase